MGFLFSVSIGESFILFDNRCPRPAPRIGVEGLSIFPDQRDHLFQAGLLNLNKVLGKSLMTVEPVFRSTDRPIQDHADDCFRVSDRKCSNRGTSNTSAHMMCT